ncbi:hypothetical protein JOE48_005506 [Methylobacterium sp. PvR107]|nr:hypothetical protein [Methylobacterium sp. PvR107]
MTPLFPVPGCRIVRVMQDDPTAITLVADAEHDHT